MNACSHLAGPKPLHHELSAELSIRDGHSPSRAAGLLSTCPGSSVGCRWEGEDGTASGVSPGLTPDQALETLLRNESDVAYRRRVRRMISYLDPRPGQTILDCGTGMGFYLKAISAVSPECRLVGIDRESAALRFAHTHVVKPGVYLARGDVQELCLDSASFDGVVMSEVLEHVEDDEWALREAWRVMKPGAILAITVPYRRYPYWYDPINRLAEGLFGRPIRTGPFAGIWANHQRLYEREQLVKLVEGAGFAIERIEELTHYCFPGTQTIVYTFGKGLVERNLLPGFIGRSTHRFRGEENESGWLNPINWLLALFDRIDRLNEDPARMATKRTYVNLAIKARKV